MKKRFRRRRLAVAGCCLLAAFLLFMGGQRTMLVLNKAARHLEVRLGNRLLERHGLFFLATMDGSHPADAVSLAPLHIRRAACARGRVGDARRIDLDHDVLIRAELLGRLTNSAATFAAWFRPDDTVRKQLLFNDRSHEEGFALALEDGSLFLTVCGRGGEVRVSCPYVGAPGRFTHVAVAFSPMEAVVFQNGRESCRMAVDGPMGFPFRPLLYGSSTFWPFEGEIDELAVWQRALGPRELASVAHSRKGVRCLYEPWLSRGLTLASWFARTAPHAYRVVDRLVPRRRPNASLAKDIPLFMAWPSKADERHFSRAHALSLRNGFRSRNAAEFRRIDIAFGDSIVSMEFALDTVYASGEARRMAFIVRDPSQKVFGGSGLVHLYPPELHSVLHADAFCPLPLSATFVRLYFGNVFQGLYVVEPFDRDGGSWMAYGSHVGAATNSIGYRAKSSVNDDPLSGPGYGEALSHVTSLVSSDVFFPWSRQEILARCRERKRQWRSEQFNVLQSGFPRRLLGANLSPLYVTDDLSLSTVPGIRWESSAPDVVSATGKVKRPDSGPPRSVILTPVDAHKSSLSPLRIRVMPARPALQTLFLHVGVPIDKYTRTDFSCLRIPAGGGKGEWLAGTASTGGGVHHRGNTSYAKGAKRSLSLKFDEPTALMDDHLPSRHLFLLSGYADPTRLRNRVSFDAYRAAANGRTPNGITAIDWAEVFINGEYFGVWELAHRVRDLFRAEEGLLYKIRSRNPILWSVPFPETSEAISPPDIRADTSGPLMEILTKVTGTSREDFAGMARANFILDSLVDYNLMLNFTQNHDGQVVNQYLAMAFATDTWFVIPWDYDKTFFNDDPTLLANRLLARLEMEMPEFRELCGAKWRRLRAGEFSDDAVLSRIDAYAERLAPYMEEDYRLKQPEGWDGDFPTAVAHLKDVVMARLHILDKRYRLYR